jgi:hypothetical protein
VALDLVGVQEIWWDKGGTERAMDFIFISMEKDTKITNWEQEFCTPQKYVVTSVYFLVIGCHI